MHRKLRVIELNLFLVAFLLFAVDTLAQKPSTFSLDPKGSYILANENPGSGVGVLPDFPDPPLIVKLSDIGLKPGVSISFKINGNESPSCYPTSCQPVIVPFTCGVFSSSSVLLDPTNLNRIPGAILPISAIPCGTPPTLFGSLPTDIPQDFVLTDQPVQIPVGAQYLFIAVDDSFYSDNVDVNHNLAVVIAPSAPLTIQTSSIPDGTVGLSYVAEVTAVGGVPPYSWSMPVAEPGFSISTSSTGVGEIRGPGSVPLPYGVLQVRITDSIGNQKNRFYAFAILPSLGSIFNQADIEKLREHGGTDALQAIAYAILARIALADPATAPLAPFFIYLAEDYAEHAGIFLALGADPSDSNYKIVASPVFPATPQAVAGAGITQQEADSLNALMKNLDQVAAYGNAAVVATNRAHGALDAGDLYWQQTQLAAAKFYGSKIATLLTAQSILRSNLQSAFVTGGFPTVQITQQDITDFETAVAQNGLPENMVQGLSILGADSNTIAIAQEFLGFLPVSPSEFPANVVSSDLDSQDVSLSKTFSLFVADRNNDGIVDCNDLSIIKQSFGKKLGQPQFDPRADVNLDGVVNVFDLATVARRLPAGTVCQ